MENKKYRVPKINEFIKDFKYEVNEMTTGGYIIMDSENDEENVHVKPNIKVYSKYIFGQNDLLCNIPYHDLAMIESLLSNNQIRVEL